MFQCIKGMDFCIFRGWGYAYRYCYLPAFRIWECKATDVGYICIPHQISTYMSNDKAGTDLLMGSTFDAEHVL